jgi:hypothetical protein
LHHGQYVGDCGIGNSGFLSAQADGKESVCEGIEMQERRVDARGSGGGVLACCRGSAIIGGNGAWTMMSRLGKLLSNSPRRHYQHIYFSLCASRLQHCRLPRLHFPSTRHATHVEPSVAGGPPPCRTVECARSRFKSVGPVSSCAMHRLNCITISSPLPITAGRIARSPQLLDVIE